MSAGLLAPGRRLWQVGGMETDVVLDLLRETAEAVIVPRFRQLDEDHIAQKEGPHDLVTVADREAEVLIARRLQEAYPDAFILGEEATSVDPRALEAVAQAPHVFTIDPVDGTRNFVNGSPDHAVMVAEARAGQAVRAWIYHPEHQRSYVAEAGAGAWADGQRMQRRGAVALGAARGATSHRGLLRDGPADLPPLQETWWSCGIDYPRLASGDVDYLVYKKDWPWDHLPGTLLVAEAGGATSRLDGAAYDLRERRPWLVTAADTEQLPAICRAINDAL